MKDGLDQEEINKLLGIGGGGVNLNTEVLNSGFSNVMGREDLNVTEEAKLSNFIKLIAEFNKSFETLDDKKFKQLITGIENLDKFLGDSVKKRLPADVGKGAKTQQDREKAVRGMDANQPLKESLGRILEVQSATKTLLQEAKSLRSSIQANVKKTAPAPSGKIDYNPKQYADKIFGPILNSIKNVDLKSIFTRIVDSIPKEQFAYPTSTSKLYHGAENGIENGPGGNGIHTMRVATLGHQLMYNGELPKGVTKGFDISSPELQSAMKKFSAMPQPWKDTMSGALVLHDSQKFKLDEYSKELRSPKPNNEHDLDTFAKIPEELKTELIGIFEKMSAEMPDKTDLLEEFRNAFEHNVGKDFGQGVSPEEKGKSRFANDKARADNPAAQLMTYTDGYVSSELKHSDINPLSGDQIGILTGGTKPYSEKEKAMIALEESSRKNINKEVIDPMDSIIANRGNLQRAHTIHMGGTDAQYQGYDIKNSTDYIKNMMETNKVKGKFSTKGYVDPKLLKAAYLDPSILPTIHNSLTKSSIGKVVQDPDEANQIYDESVEKSFGKFRKMVERMVVVINNSGKDIDEAIKDINEGKFGDRTKDRPISNERTPKADQPKVSGTGTGTPKVDRTELQERLKEAKEKKKLAELTNSQGTWGEDTKEFKTMADSHSKLSQGITDDNDSLKEIEKKITEDKEKLTRYDQLVRQIDENKKIVDNPQGKDLSGHYNNISRIKGKRSEEEAKINALASKNQAAQNALKAANSKGDVEGAIRANTIIKTTSGTMDKRKKNVEAFNKELAAAEAARAADVKYNEGMTERLKQAKSTMDKLNSELSANYPNGVDAISKSVLDNQNKKNALISSRNAKVASKSALEDQMDAKKKTYTPSKAEEEELERKRLRAKALQAKMEFEKTEEFKKRYKAETKVKKETARSQEQKNDTHDKVLQRDPNLFAKLQEEEYKKLAMENTYLEKTLEIRVRMLALQEDSLKIANAVKNKLKDDNDYLADKVAIAKLAATQARKKLELDKQMDLTEKRAMAESVKLEKEILAATGKEYSQIKANRKIGKQVLSSDALDRERLNLKNQEMLAQRRAVQNGAKVNQQGKIEYTLEGQLNALKREELKTAMKSTDLANQALMQDKKNRVANKKLTRQASPEGLRALETAAIAEDIKNRRYVRYNGRVPSNSGGGGGGGGSIRSLGQLGNPGGGRGFGNSSGGGNGNDGFISAQAKYNMKQQLWGLATPLIGIQSGIQLLKKSAEAIKQNELAAINLKRVFGGSATDFNRLADNMTKYAVKYGETIEQIGTIQEEWAKTGKDTYSQIDSLTNVTALALNTSNLENAEIAVKALNSSLLQMGMRYQEAEKLLDSWNKTADKFPADTSDFAEAYSKAGSYAKQLGLDFNQLNAIISILIERTGKSGNEVGTALRMMFSNIYRPRSIKALGELGIDAYLDKAKTKVKGFETLTNEVSAKYEEFQSKGESANSLKLVGTMGDARQRNYVVSLLEGWTEYDNVVKVSTDSIGYSAKKNDQIMQSLYKQAQQFAASIQEFAVGIGKSGALQLLKTFFTLAGGFLHYLASGNPGLRNFISTMGAVALSLKMVNMAFKGSAGGSVTFFMSKLKLLVPQLRTTAELLNAGTGGVQSGLVRRGLGFQTLGVQALGQAKLEKQTSKLLADKSLQRLQAQANMTNAQMRTMVQQAVSGQVVTPITNPVMGIGKRLKMADGTSAVDEYGRAVYTSRGVKSSAIGGKTLKISSVSKTLEQATSEGKITKSLENLNKTQGTAAAVASKTASATAQQAVATQILTKANIAATASQMALSLGIGLAIAGVVALVMHLVRAKQVAEENRQAHLKETQDLESNRVQLKELIQQRKEEIASADDKVTKDSKLLSINKEIAKLFPTLITGYDAMGNGIATNADEMERLVEAEKEHIKYRIENSDLPKAMKVVEAKQAAYDKAKAETDGILNGPGSLVERINWNSASRANSGGIKYIAGPDEPGKYLGEAKLAATNKLQEAAYQLDLANQEIVKLKVLMMDETENKLLPATTAMGEQVAYMTTLSEQMDELQSGSAESLLKAAETYGKSQDRGSNIALAAKQKMIDAGMLEKDFANKNYSDIETMAQAHTRAMATNYQTDVGNAIKRVNAIKKTYDDLITKTDKTVKEENALLADQDRLGFSGTKLTNSERADHEARRQVATGQLEQYKVQESQATALLAELSEKLLAGLGAGVVNVAETKASKRLKKIENELALVESRLSLVDILWKDLQDTPDYFEAKAKATKEVYQATLSAMSAQRGVIDELKRSGTLDDVYAANTKLEEMKNKAVQLKMDMMNAPKDKATAEANMELKKLEIHTKTLEAATSRLENTFKNSADSTQYIVARNKQLRYSLVELNKELVQTDKLIKNSKSVSDLSSNIQKKQDLQSKIETTKYTLGTEKEDLSVAKYSYATRIADANISRLEANMQDADNAFKGSGNTANLAMYKYEQMTIELGYVNQKLKANAQAMAEAKANKNPTRYMDLYNESQGFYSKQMELQIQVDHKDADIALATFNDTMTKIDQNISIFDGNIAILDAAYEGHSDSVSYLSDKYKQLDMTQKNVDKALTDTIEARKIEGLTEEESASLIQKELGLRAKLIQINKSLAESTDVVAEAKANETAAFLDFQSGLVDSNMAALDKVYSGYEDSPDYLSAKGERMKQLLDYKIDTIAAKEEALRDIENSDNPDPFKKQGLQSEIAKLKSEKLTMEVDILLNKESVDKATRQLQQNLFEKKKSLENSFTELLSSGYQKTLDKVNKYYDRINKAEDARHNKFKENLQDELDELEKKWNKQDEQDDKAEREKNLAAKDAEIAALSGDNSLWANSKREDLLKERLDLVKEINDANKEASRQAARDKIQEAQDKDDKTYEAKMKESDTARENAQNNYDYLMELLPQRVEQMVAQVAKLGTDSLVALVAALEGNTPELENAGKAIKTALDTGLNGLDTVGQGAAGDLMTGLLKGMTNMPKTLEGLVKQAVADYNKLPAGVKKEINNLDDSTKTMSTDMKALVANVGTEWTGLQPILKQIPVTFKAISVEMMTEATAAMNNGLNEMDKMPKKAGATATALNQAIITQMTALAPAIKPGVDAAVALFDRMVKALEAIEKKAQAAAKAIPGAVKVGSGTGTKTKDPVVPKKEVKKTTTPAKTKTGIKVANNVPGFNVPEGNETRFIPNPDATVKEIMAKNAKEIAARKKAEEAKKKSDEAEKKARDAEKKALAAEKKALADKKAAQAEAKRLDALLKKSKTVNPLTGMPKDKAADSKGTAKYVNPTIDMKNMPGGLPPLSVVSSTKGAISVSTTTNVKVDKAVQIGSISTTAPINKKELETMINSAVAKAIRASVGKKG